MKAAELKALTGVYRRKAKPGQLRALDPNVQRGHEEDRSSTIREFVKFGYPWCEMSEANRERPDAADLRKPGWLPTAIIVNILPPSAKRHGTAISRSDVVDIEKTTGGVVNLLMPSGFSGSTWTPSSVFPLEVIDGQHRLWAFEGFNPDDDYELPVVLFHDLDHSWQAYLFWSINITPKKINRSLAFDLYPLLRRETWLDKLGGHSIYRETRCQELVEALWRHSASPWYQHINMLGEKADQLAGARLMVTQAAWIRSLMATFVKPAEDGARRIGGLFGAPRASDQQLLPWTRSMQAAFLMLCGSLLRAAVAKSKEQWTTSLRDAEQPQLLIPEHDVAFYGKYSLLGTDQGIRGFLSIYNDLCVTASAELGLDEWTDEAVFGRKKAGRIAATDDESVSLALESLEQQSFVGFLEKIASSLAKCDWRTSSTPGLTESARLRQGVFRGSSGYKELRSQLLSHLVDSGGRVGSSAKAVLDIIK